MKILHTADWHVGRTIRGRSRADEHQAVLQEIAAVARRENVDLVLVVGDVFDTAAPGPDSERIAYQALLDLAATGADVVVVSGNHDNERRLQAVAPMASLGRVIIRATFAAAADGGIVSGTTAGGEPWRVAVVPFLSQRWVVRAHDLLALDTGDHAGEYASRVARIIRALTDGFTPDAVNLVAAHLHVAGGLLGGGERPAHTIFEYAVAAPAFPAAAHYVALGHLHRAQVIPGPCPIRYSGSPLQLDFGEHADTKSVTLIDAVPGRPASARELPLTSGRRLRTLRGSLEELAAIEVTDDDWLKVVVAERPRLGLADDVRQRFPNAVDVVVDDPNVRRDGSSEPTARARQGSTPRQLFAAYLEERSALDPKVLALFDRLLDEAVADADRPVPA